MRTSRSPILISLTCAAVVAMSACVPSAEDDDKTTDSLGSLPIPAVSSSSTSTTGVSAPDAVIVTAGTVPQPAASATAVSAADDTSDSATAATKAPTTTSGATTTTSATGPGTYTVVANDTLYGIAKKCSIGPAELAAYNDWSDGVSHLIIAGKKIKMPCVPQASSTDATSTTSAGSTPTTASGTTTTVAGGAGGTYTVQSGDTLSGIAAKTGTTVDAIIAANGWTDGDKHVIIPGQVIKMPAKT